MSRRFVRMGLAPTGAGLMTLAALMLAGCAWQNGQGGPQLQTGVVEAARPLAREPVVSPAPAAPAAPKAKVAEGKKPATYAPASKDPRPQTAAAHDEAGCANVEGCASVLKAMIADPDRAWVQRPATLVVLANGVRLFAYRSLRPKLTCRELGAALSEIETAARAYGGTVAGLAAEQADRARSLCMQVGEELRAERSRRCTSQSKGA